MNSRSGTQPLAALPSAAELQSLNAWVGKEERAAETVSALPSARLYALLDSPLPPPGPGEPIAPLAHWLHFLPLYPHTALAEDGHPRRGGFMPPVPLPRRMFAGATIAFPRPLRIGERAERVAVIRHVTAKRGRTGPLVFVGIRVEIVGEEGPAIVEEQDIVYRGLPEAGTEPARSAAPPVPPEATKRIFTPDERHLFLYSALLYSAHRIHFDHEYTTGAEGYPGLVVQGQLVATALAELASRGNQGRLAAFSYRSRQALFANDPITLAAAAEKDAIRLTAADSKGVLAMEAEARFEPR